MRPDVVFEMLEDIVFNGPGVYERHPAQVALLERGLAEVDHLLMLRPTTRGLYAVNEAKVAAGEALLALAIRHGNAVGQRD